MNDPREPEGPGAAYATPRSCRVDARTCWRRVAVCVAVFGVCALSGWLAYYFGGPRAVRGRAQLQLDALVDPTLPAILLTLSGAGDELRRVELQPQSAAFQDFMDIIRGCRCSGRSRRVWEVRSELRYTRHTVQQPDGDRFTIGMLHTVYVPRGTNVFEAYWEDGDLHHEISALAEREARKARARELIDDFGRRLAEQRAPAMPDTLPASRPSGYDRP